MDKSTAGTDAEIRTRDLLSEGAEAELRLLKQERKAEKRLADALATQANDEIRLRRAQQRLQRDRDAVAAAESSLRESQARRAAGPSLSQD